MAYAPLNGAALNGRRYPLRPVEAAASGLATAGLSAALTRTTGSRASLPASSTCSGVAVKRRGGAGAVFSTALVVGSSRVIFGGRAAVDGTAATRASVPIGRNVFCALSGVATMLLSVRLAGAQAATASVVAAAATRRKHTSSAAASSAAMAATRRVVQGGLAALAAGGYLDAYGARASLRGYSAVSATATSRVVSLQIVSIVDLVPRGTKRHGTGAAVPLGTCQLTATITVNLNPVVGLYINSAAVIRSRATIRTRATATGVGIISYLYHEATRRARAELPIFGSMTSPAGRVAQAGRAQMYSSAAVYYYGGQAPLRIAGGGVGCLVVATLGLNFIRKRLAGVRLPWLGGAVSTAWVTQGGVAECQALAEGWLRPTLSTTVSPATVGATVAATPTALRRQAAAGVATATLVLYPTQRPMAKANMTGASQVSRAYAFVNYAAPAPSHRTARVAAEQRWVRIPYESRIMRV